MSTQSVAVGVGPGTVPTFDLADRLAKALRVAGMGNQEMADYLGVSRNTVSAYVNGRGEPKRAYLVLWALRTGVDLEWIETGRARRDSNSQPSDLESGAAVIDLEAYRGGAA